jgi:2-keto-4-pentenoate hydratase/2-oxohepta-3-ene-1,7-dioic acid hydratase in catechol pathway
MKFVRYNGGRIGLLRDGLVHDVTQAIGEPAEAWPPVGMVQLIQNFEVLLPKLKSALTTVGVPAAKVHLEAPILWPNKLIAYPVNFVEHGAERNVTLRADTNGFFLKANSSLSGPSDPIILPDLPGREVHHECELAIIIGKTGRHIDALEALKYVFGYACLIDVTVRGKEDRVMRKSYDSFTPIGPAIVTQDEVGDPSALDLRLWVNSELRQHANTRDLILDVPNMISMASSVTTLFPGDIIASGTPAGVGPIAAGDQVTIEIERVGRMSIEVEQGRGGSNAATRSNAPRAN